MGGKHNVDWDVDKYFDDTEPEEHWELRRNFIIKNKNKYPESYLVALSRVFTNIEFLGCSYGQEVMQRVAELSEGVVESYREKKKTKLQRTFVKASDAAESRFSGNKQSHVSISSPQYATTITGEKSYSTVVIPHYQILLDRVRAQHGFRGQLVLLKHTPDMHPFSIISQSMLHVGGGSFPLEIEKTLKINREFQSSYNLRIGGEIICDCFADNEKDAKQSLGEAALKILQKTCFMVERKKSLKDSGATIQKEISSEVTGEKETLLNSDNVGLKLMKMMGWSGKGLGKDEHGREDNVEVKEQIHRGGLGFSSNNMNDKEVNRKLENIIRDYAHSDKTTNLVFSSDFSNTERKFLHMIAAKYNLKSRSYGNDAAGTRQLIVSRKITNWEIVTDLLKAGGSSELYDLIIPSNFKDVL